MGFAKIYETRESDITMKQTKQVHNVKYTVRWANAGWYIVEKISATESTVRRHPVHFRKTAEAWGRVMYRDGFDAVYLSEKPESNSLRSDWI